MYKPKNFTLSELAHPDLIKQYGDRLWLAFDPIILRFAQFIRDRYGPCTINNASAKDRGWRTMGSSVGADLSAHKLGRALDISINAITNRTAIGSKERAAEYAKVRAEVLKLPEWSMINFERNLSGKPITWLHCDTYNRPAREFDA